MMLVFIKAQKLIVMKQIKNTTVILYYIYFVSEYKRMRWSKPIEVVLGDAVVLISKIKGMLTKCLHVRSTPANRNQSPQRDEQSPPTRRGREENWHVISQYFLIWKRKEEIKWRVAIYNETCFVFFESQDFLLICLGFTSFLNCCNSSCLSSKDTSFEQLSKLHFQIGTCFLSLKNLTRFKF